MNKAKPVFTLVAAALCCLALLATPARAQSDATALLNSIDLLARQGWVLNCGCRVESDTADELTEQLGKPDKSDYVASAKGTYLTYERARIVAGINKGDQIFELRSTDARLDAIALSDVQAYFGAPDHTEKSGGEQYLSYVLSDALNIKFVFSSTGKDPSLKHYNVLWPKGTANLMADDPGRTW